MMQMKCPSVKEVGTWTVMMIVTFADSKLRFVYILAHDALL